MDEHLWPRPYQADCLLEGEKKNFWKNPKFQNIRDIIQNYSIYKESGKSQQLAREEIISRWQFQDDRYVEIIKDF